MERIRWQRKLKKVIEITYESEKSQPHWHPKWTPEHHSVAFDELICNHMTVKAAPSPSADMHAKRRNLKIDWNGVWTNSETGGAVDKFLFQCFGEWIEITLSSALDSFKNHHIFARTNAQNRMGIGYEESWMWKIKIDLIWLTKKRQEDVITNTKMSNANVVK